MNMTLNGTKAKNRVSAFTLDQITTEGKKLPNKAILHAKPGWGKTSFAAQAPGAVFLMVGGDTGLLTLMTAGQIPKVNHFPAPARNKEDVEAAIMALAGDSKHPHKLLVVDGMRYIEEFNQEKTCQEKYKGDWLKFNSFDAGAKEAAKEWPSILDCLNHCVEAGIGVLLLAHSKVAVFKNPHGPDYERWVPQLSKYSWEAVEPWADMVLFGDFEVTVDKLNDSKSDAKTKGKGIGGEHRILYTTHNAAHDAKNRHGLPAEVDGGDSAAECWSNFINALKGGKQ